MYILSFFALYVWYSLNAFKNLPFLFDSKISRVVTILSYLWQVFNMRRVYAEFSLPSVVFALPFDTTSMYTNNPKYRVTATIRDLFNYSRETHDKLLHI